MIVYNAGCDDVVVERGDEIGRGVFFRIVVPELVVHE